MTTAIRKVGTSMNAPPKNNDAQNRVNGLGTCNHGKTKNQYFSRHRRVGQAEDCRRTNLTAELEKRGFTLFPTLVGTYILVLREEDCQ